MTRFIATTMFAGHVYVRGIPDNGPWDAARLELQDEETLDRFLRGAAGDRKVWTIAEMDAAVTESRTPQRPGLPNAAMSVWVHEGLVDELRRRWEHDPRERA